MSWRIQIPNRGRDQSVADALLDARTVTDPESQAVARTILLEAAMNGMSTVGEVLDRIERADPAERRRILDAARVSAGLETSGDVEGHRQFVAANDRLARRSRPVPACAVCGRHPTDSNGMLEEVPRVRKWHCLDCAHLAQSGDLEPPPLPIDPRTMGFADPGDFEREQRRDALREKQATQHRDEREIEAEENRRRKENRESRAAREWRETFFGLGA